MNRQEVIDDNVHGNIQLCLQSQAICKTKHFQRLSKIKQLGVCQLATHTRDEHCVGTYYLALLFMDHLETNTPDLKIPKLYKTCVALAGLLHDIGHGPFSHFWESCSKIEHEENCKDCIDAIFEEVPQSLFKKLKEEGGVELIKAFITAEFVKIKPGFEFLFEIINNKQCDIDVDKWDYLKRDYFYVAKYLPETVHIDLDFDKVFKDARVSKDGAHIEYKYEHLDKIYKIFQAREQLHIYIYRNPSCMILANVLRKAIKLAEQRGHKFHGKNFTQISSADKEIFLKLTDNNVVKALKDITDSDICKLMEIYETGAIKEVQPKENNNIADSLPDYLSVDIKIEHAGEKMKEERIIFYGNIEDKPVITKTRGFYERTHYFQQV